MVGNSSSSGTTAAGFYAAAAASETDGDTFDGDAEFDEYDDWDYAEMLSAMSKNLKTYVLQPLVVGAAAALGMSIGFAIFDATASIFTRRSTRGSTPSYGAREK
ncbi:hypothetical protein BWQ96_06663 [Gracilariopsis chorda]|uniref:Uncharacterized protein n=1 Tax=Gracilariopsis chorda TaxID=448386 RepID=A0A2V3IN90_9FLOR|nr:hypothetical protein BWQ96_06663 [Gracilariopsis chorda]|eukprot:PXF43551.1 hypothetical protein BWQ96_06663 [Gracilariopsis chorda]